MIRTFQSPFLSQKFLGFGVPEVHLTSRNNRSLGLMSIAPLIHGFPFPSSASPAPFPDHITTQMTCRICNHETPNVLFPSLILFSFQRFDLFGVSLITVLHGRKSTTLSRYPNITRSMFFNELDTLTDTFTC